MLCFLGAGTVGASLIAARLPSSSLTVTNATATNIETTIARILRERAEQILNAIDDGVYCLDAAGNAIFVNEAATRMLGYGVRELLGKPQHELLHHTYADGTPFPKEACPISMAVTDGVQQRVGGDVFWKKGGEKLWVDYTAIPIKEGRRVVAAVVTFRDASIQQRADEQTERLESERTARAEAESARAALERSEERYRALVRASDQFIWTNSPDGRMHGEQPGWSALTGQTPAEYEGFGWASAVHQDDAPATLAAWNAAIYVAQIEDDRLSDVNSDRRYIDATRDVLQKHGGLWFYDESFVISRRRE